MALVSKSKSKKKTSNNLEILHPQILRKFYKVHIAIPILHLSIPRWSQEEPNTVVQEEK